MHQRDHRRDAQDAPQAILATSLCCERDGELLLRLWVLSSLFMDQVEQMPSYQR